MHVPEENLNHYRALKSIADQYDRLGNSLSNIGHYAEANEVWRKSAEWLTTAQQLRVPGKAEQATWGAGVIVEVPVEPERLCVYCAAPEFKEHTGFCLTRMENAKPMYTSASSS